MRSALVALVVAGCWTSSSTKEPAPEPPGGKWKPDPPVERATKRREPKLCDELSCLLEPDPACCAKYVKKPPPPPPPPPPGTLPQLDRATIVATMASVKPQVVACGSRAPGTKGTLKIKVSVSTSGATTATVQQSLAAPIDACVVAAINRARFPRTQTPTTFVYPYLF